MKNMLKIGVAMYCHTSWKLYDENKKNNILYFVLQKNLNPRVS